MNAYCPLCETDLDPRSGVCPACRWQNAAILSVARPGAAARMTLTERYRGTEWDSSLAGGTVTVPRHGGIPRGPAMLLVGILALGGVYGAIMAMMGVLP